jgi:hypothetical protein
MSRTIKEIYNEAVQERNRRLELTEFASDSKLSVMNGSRCHLQFRDAA